MIGKLLNLKSYKLPFTGDYMTIPYLLSVTYKYKQILRLKCVQCLCNGKVYTRASMNGSKQLAKTTTKSIEKPSLQQ